MNPKKTKSLRDRTNEKLNRGVGIINVPVKVGISGWRKCWTIMMTHSVVFGVNEALYRRMKVAYAGIAQLNGWGVGGLWGSPNPVFFDRTLFRRVETNVHKLHPSYPGRKFRGFRAARYATQVTLRNRETKREAVFINVHLAAYNNTKVPHSWVDEMHERSFVWLEQRINKLLDEGYDVYLMGDFNTPAKAVINVRPHGVQVFKGVGIDKLFRFYPKDEGQPVEFKVFHYEAPTDHKSGIVAQSPA